MSTATAPTTAATAAAAAALTAAPTATTPVAAPAAVTGAVTAVKTVVEAPAEPAPVIQTSWLQWSSDVANKAQATFIAVVIYVSAVFGAIIAANYAITEGHPRRFLAFLYGFAWYPFSLGYALYDPPEWYATIYPFVEGPPGLFSYPKPTVTPVFTKIRGAGTKGSTPLRIMSGILLLCNMYVGIVLINTRFFT